uniref:Nonstructural protein 3 n=1 Tax=Porcine rotavirus H TaxID=1420855 RepID=A0A3G9E9Q3_9REOV|nr:Nonstructural protein 3 [Porcine rotavirus H]
MAELVCDALATLTRNVYGDNEESAKFCRMFRTMITDSGLYQNINNWRNAFYKERMPKRMSYSTVSIQIQNLEREILKIREEGFCSGWDRKKRTLNAFDIGENKDGHTILIPTTQLSKIILQNSCNVGFVLQKIPDQLVENLRSELEEEKKCNDLFRETVIKLKEKIKQFEDYKVEADAANFILEDLKIKYSDVRAERDEARTLLAGICNKYGLIMEISDTTKIFEPKKEGKRKGRKNRRSEITFGDFEFPIGRAPTISLNAMNGEVRKDDNSCSYNSTAAFVSTLVGNQIKMYDESNKPIFDVGNHLNPKHIIEKMVESGIPICKSDFRNNESPAFDTWNEKSNLKIVSVNDRHAICVFKFKNDWWCFDDGALRRYNCNGNPLIVANPKFQIDGVLELNPESNSP